MKMENNILLRQSLSDLYKIDGADEYSVVKFYRFFLHVFYVYNPHNVSLSSPEKKWTWKVPSSFLPAVLIHALSIQFFLYRMCLASIQQQAIHAYSTWPILERMGRSGGYIVYCVRIKTSALFTVKNTQDNAVFYRKGKCFLCLVT